MYCWTSMIDCATLHARLVKLDHSADVAQLCGELQDAESHCREAWKRSVTVFGGLHADTIRRQNTLAGILGDIDKHEEAERMYRDVVAWRVRELGRRHRSTLISMTNLAVVLSEQGQNEGAENLLRHVVKVRGAELGPDHPTTLVSITNLATVLSDQHRFTEAEGLYRLVLQKQLTNLSRDPISTSNTLSRLASTLQRQSRPVQMALLLHHALAKYRQVLGAGHPGTVACRELYETLVLRREEAGFLGTHLAALSARDRRECGRRRSS